MLDGCELLGVRKGKTILSAISPPDGGRNGGMTTLRRLAILAFGLWTLVLASSLGWNLYQNRHQTLELAHKEALANFNKDQAFRLWGTRHGGVYVPATEDTPPSPYMEHIPERDVVTPSGRTLTLLNPNYMVRQISELYQDLYGVRGHITGLVLLRPENAADIWETNALQEFEHGRPEVTAVTEIEGEPYFRLMRPMVMEEGCMKCHGHLGYKVGDVRGGVGVAVPMKPYFATLTRTNTALVISHGALWLLGVVALGLGAGHIRRHIRDTLRAEAAVRQLNEELERRVEERTGALREQEGRLRMMVTTAADGIMTVDESGIIESFNAAAAKIFDYTPDEISGQPVQQLVPEGIAHLWQHEEEGGHETSTSPKRGRESEGRRKSGAAFPLYIAVSTLKINQKTLYTAIVRDLTDEKLIEAELLLAKEWADNARKQAEKANRAKSEFLSSISHELRTPLNGILGFAQLLQYYKAEPLRPKQKEYVGHILTGGTHLLHLINEILDLSRIETGNFALSIETVSAATAIRECVDIVSPAAQRKGIHLQCSIIESTQLPLVRADFTRLKQVLVNLVSNAIKYNRPDGTATLTATVDTERRCLQIIVQDTGRGIPQDRMDELFQPFNRLGAETGVIEGTGIGLSITKKLVELMQGRILVESKEGQGSVFTVEIPLAETDASVASPRIMPPCVADEQHLSLPSRPMTFLYIEDNPGNQTVMVEFLQRFPSITLRLAGTAEEGLEIASAEHPSLIIMDINLPGIDGFTALMRLRQRPETRDIPVIAISASAMPTDIHRGLAAGFQDYLTKPLEFTALIKTIKATLEAPVA